MSTIYSFGVWILQIRPQRCGHKGTIGVSISIIYDFVTSNRQLILKVSYSLYLYVRILKCCCPKSAMLKIWCTLGITNLFLDVLNLLLLAFNDVFLFIYGSVAFGCGFILKEWALVLCPTRERKNESAVVITQKGHHNVNLTLNNSR